MIFSALLSVHIRCSKCLKDASRGLKDYLPLQHSCLFQLTRSHRSTKHLCPDSLPGAGPGCGGGGEEGGRGRTQKGEEPRPCHGHGQGPHDGVRETGAQPCPETGGEGAGEEDTPTTFCPELGGPAQGGASVEVPGASQFSLLRSGNKEGPPGNGIETWAPPQTVREPSWPPGGSRRGRGTAREASRRQGATRACGKRRVTSRPPVWGGDTVQRPPSGKMGGVPDRGSGKACGGEDTPARRRVEGPGPRERGCLHHSTAVEERKVNLKNDQKRWP